MAIFTGTASTFDLKGLREDLTDVIWNISPTETPFVNSVTRAKATATLHEWQTDSLATAAANAQIQGDDLASTDSVTATTRLNNDTQISRKSLAISGTTEAVNKAGRRSEVAYQVAKKGKELKRDIEFVVLQNTAKVAASAGTAGKTASVLSWIKTNTSKASDGSDPAAADGTGTRTDGTTRSFTQNFLNTVLESIWSNSGDAPEICMLPGLMKQTASTFTGNVQRMEDTKDKRLVTAIDVYVYDFGQVKMVPNRFMRTRDVLVINSDLWAMAWLRPIKVVDLAVTGDATKKMLVGEYALECRNEAGSGGIFDLA